MWSRPAGADVSMFKPRRGRTATRAGRDEATGGGAPHRRGARGAGGARGRASRFSRLRGRRHGGKENASTVTRVRRDKTRFAADVARLNRLDPDGGSVVRRGVRRVHDR